MSLIKKIWTFRWIFRAFIPSLIFNFRHLPFSQARKLPILLYKADDLGGGGSYSIEGPVRFGMIVLGRRIVDLYPNSGITLSNKGKIIFRGKVQIGNDAALSVGPSGSLCFGDDIIGSASLKIACYDSVSVGDRVRIGWNTQIIDTDFHLLKAAGGRKCDGPGYASVKIGEGVWIANSCKIYKGTVIPHSCVVASDTVLHSSLKCEPCSVISNDKKMIIRAVGYYRDLSDDSISYPDPNGK